jgi:hypothetical protein
MPAHITAKIVIASAKRLMLVRQFCRNRNRIAEISVPAWPMPTQNTKLTIGQPQPGWLLPQTPTPVKARDAEGHVPRERRLRLLGERGDLLGHLRVGGRAQDEIRAAGRIAPGCCRSPSRWSFLGVLRGRGAGRRVAQLGEVRGTRTDVQLGQHPVGPVVVVLPPDPALRVAEVAEDDRVGGHACAQAGTISPSRMARSSRFASIFTAWMRWTQ